MSIRSVLTALFIFFGLAHTLMAMECPFCSGVRQPLSEEMSSADVVAIVTIVEGSETDYSDAVFKFEKLLKGEKLLAVGDELPIPYFGSAAKDQKFLLFGIDPPELLWSFPRPVTDDAVKYLEAVIKLPSASDERLAFYLKYLEHKDPMLAQDAYDEFGGAPYEDVKKLKPKMNRDQLIKWLNDKEVSADHRRLYFVMLGICGERKDAELLVKMMKSDDPLQRAGLDSLIGCYITLTGADGLGLVEDLFLKDEQREYGDTFAALNAIRFHGTEGGVVDRKRLVKSMRLILDRREYADLVIPDLARWEDWEQVDRLVQMFKDSDDETSWVRVPIINYLRACPLPAAKEKLKELEKIDPDAFNRARTFFPSQGAGASIRSPATYAIRKLVAKRRPPQSATASLLESRGLVASRNLVSDATVTLTGTKAVAAATGTTALPAPITLSIDSNRSPAAEISVRRLNRFFPAGVILTAAATVAIMMWLAISGAGNPAISRTVTG